MKLPPLVAHVVVLIGAAVVSALASASDTPPVAPYSERARADPYRPPGLWFLSWADAQGRPGPCAHDRGPCGQAGRGVGRNDHGWQARDADAALQHHRHRVRGAMDRRSVAAW